MNCHTDPGHTWGIGHRKVMTGFERHFVFHADFAAKMQQEYTVGDIDYPNPADFLHRINDLLAVLFTARVHGKIITIIHTEKGSSGCGNTSI